MIEYKDGVYERVGVRERLCRLKVAQLEHYIVDTMKISLEAIFCHQQKNKHEKDIENIIYVLTLVFYYFICFLSLIKSKK